MKVIEIRAIRGPNYYSLLPVILMKLDLEDLEYRPTHTVEGFRENIEYILPSLYEHTCSPGVEGGFFQRIERGTWAGHVVEHVAIELQSLLGHNISFGKTFTLDEEGIYDVVYRYENEDVGLRAGAMALEIVEKLFEGELTEIDSLLKELKAIEEASLFGPSTQSIVDEATERGIPHYRLNDYSYVQLGQGKYQRRFEATVADSTSALGVEIAADKSRTKEILYENGVPVPMGKAVKSLEAALDLAKSLEYPVTVKPLSGNHGRGVCLNILNEEELKTAFNIAKNISTYVVIEKYLVGFDFRILVIDGKFEAAALRQPAFVRGNGSNTIKELIEEVNRDPNRGEGHEKILTKIKIDDETIRTLEMQDLTLEDIPEKGNKIYVKSAANLSNGGTAIDVTESVHRTNQIMAERIAKLVGLDIIGIDIIAKTLVKPVEMGTGGVVEVNAGPGLRMHLNPSEGTPRNVAKSIVDMMFPEGSKFEIPICSVTATNGKTTTTRLIAHILSMTGATVGVASTDAVVIDKIPILKGDYSGPGGALAVIKDSSVDYAVLEVARGGILRRGLGYDRSDVGVFLNVSSDHLGISGVNTLEQLAKVKSTVTEAVKKDGCAIFNADDPLVLQMAERTKANVMLFSMDSSHPALLENLQKGNMNVTVCDEKIVLQKPGGNSIVADINDIPICFEGLADFNIANAMAAVGASYSLGIQEDKIRDGLISFSPSVVQSPGRMNLIEIGEFKTIIDYGHNIGAIKATKDFFNKLMPGRVIRVAAGVGDRRTEDIIELGRELAGGGDIAILYDSAPRGRVLGETAELVKKGLLECGFGEEKIFFEFDEQKALLMGLNMAKPGDLVAMQADHVDMVINTVLDFKKEFTEKANKE